MAAQPSPGITSAAAPLARDLIGFASHLGELASALLRQRARGDFAVETKPDGTPVTDVDRAVEQAVRAEIAVRFPAHGVLGEEFPPTNLDAEWLWIVDPLDGTKEFIQGLPLFGFLLALAHRGEIVLGLAQQPLTGDCWLGAAGHGTTWNSRPVHVRPCARLVDAVVSTQGYDTFCATRHDLLAPIRAAAHNTVAADSCLVFGLLAAGRVDLIVSDGFALHDFAALDAIVRHAGGTMTDWQGRRLTLQSGRSVLAAGDAALLPEVTGMLAG